jgi:parvulin-like peptidyl-prolyl isomerase
VSAGEADPAKGMSDEHKMLMYTIVRSQTDVKVLYQDFRKTVPKEGQAHAEESVNGHFDEYQLPVLLKREKVISLAELETALHAKGSSIDRERRIFREQFIAMEWVRQQLKVEDEKGGESDDITHADMIAWYQAHIKDFEQEPRARWEELTVAFTRFPSREAAYGTLAAMGNRVLAGAPFGDVARSGSDGPTAHDGGKRDWTHQGSLSAESLDRALFNLPIGQLSPILESPSGYHIIRVVERQERTVKSFLDAQKEVKAKIKKERSEARYQKYLKELREKVPIWTVFDASMQPQHNPDDDDRYAARPGPAQR